jgi:hypothetical protein
MTQSQFEITMGLFAAAGCAAIYAYAYSLAGPRTRSWLLLGVPILVHTAGRHAPAPGRKPTLVIDPVHVGVTEDSPTLVSVMQAAGALDDMTSVEAVRAVRADPTVVIDLRPEPPVLHRASHALDPEAQAILDQLDKHVRAWRKAPEYITDFQDRVNAAHRMAGLDDEAHRRWRAAAWDVATGGYPVISAPPAYATA